MAQPTVNPTTPIKPYEVWKNRDFACYTASWFLLMFAVQVETVAVGIHVYQETHNALSLAWIGLARALPVIALAIAGGHLADHFNRRNILICTLALGMLSSIGLFGVAYWQGSLLWMYAFLFLGSVAQALGSPARSALLPQVVRPEIFPLAVTWNSTIFQISTLTGPAVGGLLVGLDLYTPPAFLVAFQCRLMALLTIVLLHTRQPARKGEPMKWETVVAGLRFVRNTPMILATITLDLFAVLLGGATYLLPQFATDILHVGGLGQGFLRSAEAVGAIIMAMLIAHLPPMKHAGRGMLLAVTGFGLATIVFGLSHNFWLSLTAMFFIGVCDSISVIVRHTLVQVLTPDSMRGRVSAVNNIFIVSSNDIGGFESGVTSRLLGPIISVVGGGIGTILVVLAADRIWPEIRKIGSLNDIKPQSVENSDAQESGQSRA